ncbi:hypothetical protein N3K66_003683 [Trichothecium roseum]|uniref:Uncharacterized protein n=1 Tax=Trichothecium roseum TaxID=47278 RepID=A0ACC0V7G7_9HYPO|nr:hypothetical protein N3K66_003683 [Trichothecium roseum]
MGIDNECGSCDSRDKLYKLVRSKDPGNIITKKLIGWHDSTEYEANDLSYNPNRQGECYLCHRLFNFRRGLDQHLNSPAHQQSLYHCPNRNCAKDFKTLAAIINHLESESCGCTRFETVQRSIHNVMSGDRLISF